MCTSLTGVCTVIPSQKRLFLFLFHTLHICIDVVATNNMATRLLLYVQAAYIRNCASTWNELNWYHVVIKSCHVNYSRFHSTGSFFLCRYQCFHLKYRRLFPLSLCLSPIKGFIAIKCNLQKRSDKQRMRIYFWSFFPPKYYWCRMQHDTLDRSNVS